MVQDSSYLDQISKIEPLPESAGIGFGLAANARWFLAQQSKILRFDEGVFVFMLAFGLVFNALLPMLWIFAASQLYWGLFRAYQNGRPRPGIVDGPVQK